MAHRGVQRRVAEARAEDGDEARHLRPALGRLHERLEVEGETGETPAHHVGDPAAVVVAEADERQPALARPARHPVLLAHVDLAGGAGEHGRVDRDHADLAAVDPREAGDHGIGRRRPRPPVLGLGEQPELVPGTGIDQRRQALARGQAPARMLPRDPLGAAHAERLLAAALELGERIGGRLAHRPVNVGARFSPNAATPSATSALPCSRATVSAACAARSQAPAARKSLAAATAVGERAASVAAHSSRLREVRACRHDLVDEARRQGLPCVERLAGEDQVLERVQAEVRAAADEARPRDEAHGRLREPEARRLVGDDQVADERQLAAAAERVAVDGGDRRRPALLDGAERRHRLAHVAAPVGHPVELAEGCEVAADREAAPVAVEHDRSHRRRPPRPPPGPPRARRRTRASSRSASPADRAPATRPAA